MVSVAEEMTELVPCLKQRRFLVWCQLQSVNCSGHQLSKVLSEPDLTKFPLRQVGREAPERSSGQKVQMPYYSRAISFHRHYWKFLKTSLARLRLGCLQKDYGRFPTFPLETCSAAVHLEFLS